MPRCPGLCRHRPGHAFISEKNKVARNEKRKKLQGFSYYKNIANFEAFWRDKNFSKNLLYLGLSFFGWLFPASFGAYIYIISRDSLDISINLDKSLNCIFKAFQVFDVISKLYLLFARNKIINIYC